MADESNVTPMKGGRTRQSIRAAIETELTEARVKEVRSKLKKLVEELATAKAVVAGKEAEITALFEDYSDVLPE